MMLSLKGQAQSNQHIYLQRGRMRFMTNEAKKLKESYISQIKEQMNSQEFEGYHDSEVCMTIHLYHGDKRKRDIDNYGKLILDSMNGLLFNDDSQIQSMQVCKYYDKNDPRAEVDIRKVR